MSSLPLRGVDRPLLSRSDLPQLKQYDRAQILNVLGSFDDRELSDRAFVLRMGALLNPDRLPGLTEATEAGDAERILSLVSRACTHDATTPRLLTPDMRAVADDALQHRFTFYGETCQLPPVIDWDANPGSGHWGHDLNRFSYLSALTQACLATGESRYGRKAVSLILDWIKQCDIGRCFMGSPYAFGSYLNNAIHCGAWSACIAVLLADGQVQPIELLRVLKSLHDQLAYLEIVTNGHAGNWPTIGCQHMLVTAAAFPILRDTDRIAAYCTHALAAQIAEQVLPDGVQDELTPHYHRVVVNNLLAAEKALRTLGRTLNPQTLATLRKMVHYVQQTTTPDGSKQVAFNDSDPGTPGTIRRQLADLGLSDFLSPVEQLGPEVFPYAGVAFLRQRQDVGDLYLAFDGGPFGRAHQHEDGLGFWLFAYGRSFLVDPGRHLYDGSEKSFRAHLKSTTAHSTIKVDGQDQHSAGRRDTWIAKAPLNLGWRAGGKELRASGTYDLGYGERNETAVTHRREIVFVRERCWVVFDVVTGNGEHLVESRFQFAPGTLHREGTTVRTEYDDANLLLRAVSVPPFTDSHVEHGQQEPRGGWYSDSYGKIEPAPALSLSVRTTLPFRAVTLLYPYRGVTPPVMEVAFDGRTATLRGGEANGWSVTTEL
jgi:hypothetical protein